MTRPTVPGESNGQRTPMLAFPPPMFGATPASFNALGSSHAVPQLPAAPLAAPQVMGVPYAGFSPAYSAAMVPVRSSGVAGLPAPSRTDAPPPSTSERRPSSSGAMVRSSSASGLVASLPTAAAMHVPPRSSFPAAASLTAPSALKVTVQQCRCGSYFVEGSKFCLMCGMARQQGAPVPPPAVARQASAPSAPASVAAPMSVGASATSPGQSRPAFVPVVRQSSVGRAPPPSPWTPQHSVAGVPSPRRIFVSSLAASSPQQAAGGVFVASPATAAAVAPPSGLPAGHAVRRSASVGSLGSSAPIACGTPVQQNALFHRSPAGALAQSPRSEFSAGASPAKPIVVKTLLGSPQISLSGSAELAALPHAPLARTSLVPPSIAGFAQADGAAAHEDPLQPQRWPDEQQRGVQRTSGGAMSRASSADTLLRGLTPRASLANGLASQPGSVATILPASCDDVAQQRTPEQRTPERAPTSAQSVNRSPLKTATPVTPVEEEERPMDPNTMNPRELPGESLPLSATDLPLPPGFIYAGGGIRPLMPSPSRRAIVESLRRSGNAAADAAFQQEAAERARRQAFEADRREFASQVRLRERQRSPRDALWDDDVNVNSEARRAASDCASVSDSASGFTSGTGQNEAWRNAATALAGGETLRRSLRSAMSPARSSSVGSPGRAPSERSASSSQASKHVQILLQRQQTLVSQMRELEQEELALWASADGQRSSRSPGRGEQAASGCWSPRDNLQRSTLQSARASPGRALQKGSAEAEAADRLYRRKLSLIHALERVDVQVLSLSKADAEVLVHQGFQFGLAERLRGSLRSAWTPRKQHPGPWSPQAPLASEMVCEEVPMECAAEEPGSVQLSYTRPAQPAPQPSKDLSDHAPAEASPGQSTDAPACSGGVPAATPDILRDLSLPVCTRASSAESAATVTRTDKSSYFTSVRGSPSTPVSCRLGSNGRIPGPEEVPVISAVVAEPSMQVSGEGGERVPWRTTGSVGHPEIDGVGIAIRWPAQASMTPDAKAGQMMHMQVGSPPRLADTGGSWELPAVSRVVRADGAVPSY
eukprot:TRINITY_DN35628_c0_g1_i1.p1 TRINITY_DN35628_c0_g1~~TRINITY_DN35628_c0_g1_i1.p1  ORF type:complete len:1057 (+),score=165.35 TRINITY_DN35628_c0_g1_i1:100-3270(+)